MYYLLTYILVCGVCHPQESRVRVYVPYAQYIVQILLLLVFEFSLTRV